MMLFRSVKYPLGSTTVCPDTESETCDKRKRDKICYQIQCMYMYTKLLIYRAVITAYNIKGRLKMCFLCLFFFFLFVFFSQRGMEEELLNWSLISTTSGEH